MANDIIQFSPGGKVTAEETNENNLLLKEWALDNSQSEAYIDGKIATLTSNLNSQISSLNSQIATKAPLSNPTLTGTVKVPSSKTAGTALCMVETGNNYLMLGERTMLQWGYGSTDGGTGTVTTYKPYGSKTSFSAFITDTGSSTITSFKVSGYPASNQFTIQATQSGDGNKFRWFTIGRY